KGNGCQVHHSVRLHLLHHFLYRSCVHQIGAPILYILRLVRPCAPNVPAMSLQLSSNILAREAFDASYQRAFHTPSPSERETPLVTADVCFHHHLAELFQRCLRLPSQFALCFGWVTNEQIDLGGAVELRVHANQSTPGFTIDTDLVLFLTFPMKVEASRCASHSKVGRASC